MNYRSVVVFGTGVQVDDVDEKRRAVDAIVDHVIAGRSADARPRCGGSESRLAAPGA